MEKKILSVNKVTIMIIICIACIFTACGYWSITGTYCCGKQESASSLYLAFFSDGTCAMYGQKQPLLYGTYKEMTDNSAQFIIQIEDKKYDAEYKKNQLIVFDEEGEMIFDRIDNTPVVIVYQ